MPVQEIAAEAERDRLTLNYYLKRAVENRGDAIALIHANSAQRVTYGQIGQKAEALARAFRKLGIRKGDVVSVQLPNWPEFVYVHFALARIGAVTNPINPVYRGREVNYILRFSESVAIVVPGPIKGFSYLSMIQEMRADLPSLRHIIMADAEVPEGVLSLARMIDNALSDPSLSDEPPECRPGPEDVALLMYTSGTTAEPKGVVQTHRSMVSSGLGCAKILGVGRGPNEVHLALPSFATSFGLYANLYAPLFHQAAVVSVDSFNVEETLRIMQQERVTHVGLVPGQLMALLSAENLSRYDLGSVRSILYAGAVCPVEVARSAMETFGCRLGTIYAMTEIAPCCGTDFDDSAEVVCFTVGRPTGGTEVQIVDDDGRTASIGVTGEILVRGPGLFSGYLKKPELTSEAMTSDGWYRTGDLGWIDERGNVHIGGRKKDIINRGGYKISAREVEDLLFAHPGIRDAAVVAMPDPKLGERSCAYVVLKAGHQLTLEQVVEHLKGTGLATYKLPERLEIVDRLPYTPAGKVQKFTLRDDIKAKLEKEAKGNI